MKRKYMMNYGERSVLNSAFNNVIRCSIVQQYLIVENHDTIKKHWEYSVATWQSRRKDVLGCGRSQELDNSAIRNC